jgi:hypothetical protein
MKLEITHRWSGRVVFTAELSEDEQKLSLSIRLGVAIKQAIQANANLRSANLRSADLSGADLSSADLSGAKNLAGVQAASLLMCPEEGSFIAWKKCQGEVIVKLLVPAESRRSTATSRKCRTEFVDVLEVFGADVGVSGYNPNVKYRKGERVTCHEWEENRWIECGGGIHFYITRVEAEAHML